MIGTNTQHKDRLFKFIFGNPDRKEWTLKLYNALNGSNYTDPDAIEFNTLDDALYMGMKNDVSFIIAFEMNLWEHQSSFSPNLPVRMFIYAGHLYEKYITGENFLRFSRKLQRLPKPRLICFYNGTEYQPEEKILRLSEAFGNDDGDIEVRVRMLNINYGRNMELMKSCRLLDEYSYFVEATRTKQRGGLSLDEAVDAVIDEMPDDFELKKFLIGHRAEVKGMFLQEYNIEKDLEALRDEERAEGRAKGVEDTNRRVASDMLKEKMPLSLIAKISRLTEAEILTIADSLGISPA